MVHFDLGAVEARMASGPCSHFAGSGQVLIAGWDALGSTPCCGTNVVFQRAALTAVGGFTYGSITEDFLTSLTLHAGGYESRYVTELLAMGLAPTDLVGRR
jgi:cellulose synthase (UDP-forming)